MNADVFGSEAKEEQERKDLRNTVHATRQTAMGFLGKAVGFYKRAAKGDPSPTLVGKSIAYLLAFQELAPIVGIRKDSYQKIVHAISENVGKLLQEVEENSRKTIIEHRRDPEGVALEARKMELREKAQEIRIEDRREPAPPLESLRTSFEQPTDEGVIKEVIQWLMHSQLGYDKAEAEKRARRVYQPGIPVPELISAACRGSA